MITEEILTECRKHGNECGLKIAPVYGNKAGIVTVISDDGNFETSGKLNALSKETQIPITVAGVVQNVAPHEEHWKNLLAEGNLELINHSYSHYRMDENWADCAKKESYVHEIIDAKRYFATLGCPTDVFVCPENILTELGNTVLKENAFKAVRRGNRGHNSLDPQPGTEPGNWLHLQCFGMMDVPAPGKTREQTRAGWVEGACEGKWLVEMWHNIDVNGYQTVSYDEARGHLYQIAAHKDELWCTHFSKAVRYLWAKQHAALYSCKEDGAVCLCVLVDDKDVADTTELTVLLGDGKQCNVRVNRVYKL